MTDDHEHDHEHHGHDHEHDGHDHDHDHDHDHALIVDRLPAGTWRVDPDGSEVLFKARALFGLLPVSGIFERFTGEMNVDESGLATGKLLVEPAPSTPGLPGGTRSYADALLQRRGIPPGQLHARGCRAEW